MLEPFTDTGKPSASSAAASIALIAAHPDDEILGLGGQLAGMRHLSLIHVTDGAPRDPADALHAGFATRRSYARARALELERALRAAGAAEARRRALDFVDQEAIESLPELIAILEEELSMMAAVITHPYEGGHPDHDACALAVQCACRQLVRSGRTAPKRLEFASYHARHGRLAAGVFWPDPSCLERSLTLDDRQLTRKRTALAEFATQKDVIAFFPMEIERWRPAPEYDFTQPPPPGDVLYDDFHWRITGQLWRERARTAMERLQCLH